eukprot:TRINITY_DN2989_c0_g1::TRINITY_DN2989_c0_g1_i1::g.4265::m.4265 TRINITY_DN2989_c0_g1::TRINITY_DN2989_c0_g1_i1::g.4265  ORF type:complete len:585 (-),score=88.14,sp/Q75J93/CPAS1_DICDI/27.56/3e-52,VWA_2/PF13519.1/2.5e-13,VWA_2/PF13519.1/2.4e+03,Sec23_trunk/PF04811.10/0.0011,Sec23_trunk/PF04811.10/3.3,Glyco_hydro_25/PF01183.15/38,Glyco_hydro_25/PF01183.15/9.3 TRINITY_DN2989_c0_g1_i1:82-1743(-)
MAVNTEISPQAQTVDFVISRNGDARDLGAGSGLLVICVDTSGSMCTSTRVPELLGMWQQLQTSKAHKGGALNALQSEGQPQEYISRLQCVKAALDLHLTRLLKTHPQKRVCLITFNSKVTISQAALTGESSNMCVLGNVDEASEDSLYNHGRGVQCQSVRALTEGFDPLRTAVMGMDPDGCTALGPALVTALGMCSNWQQSEIMLCTDGLANIGVGDLEDNPDREFYDRLAGRAQKLRCNISVIAVQGGDCAMEVLGNLADKTGGTVNIVNPLELIREVRSIYQTPVIATDVVLTLYAPPCLAWTSPYTASTNTPPSGANSSSGIKGVFSKLTGGVNDVDNKGGNGNNITVDQDGRRLIYEAGNVTADDVVTFPFYPLPDGAVPKNKSVLFHAKISFRRIDGSRVIRWTRMSLGASRSREEAEVKMNVMPVAALALSQAASYALKREYDMARAVLMAGHQYMFQLAHTQEQREEYNNFIQRAEQLDSELRTCRPGSTLTDSVSKAAWRVRKVKAVELKSGRKKTTEVQRRQVRGDLQEHVVKFSAQMNTMSAF